MSFVIAKHEGTSILDKVFKNGPSEICGRRPLKNLKYGLLKHGIMKQHAETTFSPNTRKLLKILHFSREPYPKLFENCSFPQNFHTRKLGEISVF